MQNLTIIVFMSFVFCESVFAIDFAWQQRARNRRTSPSEHDSEISSFFPKAYGTPESLKDLSDAIDLINAKAKDKFYGSNGLKTSKVEDDQPSVVQLDFPRISYAQNR